MSISWEAANGISVNDPGDAVITFSPVDEADAPEGNGVDRELYDAFANQGYRRTGPEESPKPTPQ